MGLVDYSSSDCEDTEEGSRGVENPSSPLKRKRDDSTDLPPLPSKFHDLYASTTRVSTKDDPSLHGGRKRVIPHVEGNWPGHLYIEWYPSTIEHDSLSELISILKTKSESGDIIQSSLTSDLGAPLPLHISLSRTLGFSIEEKDRFASSLETAIKSSGIRPFNVSFTGLDWVANFEKTRWFLVLRIGKPDADGLNKLLYTCNSTTQEYGQPVLYARVTDHKPKPTPGKSPRGKRLKSQQRTDWSSIQDVSDAFHISIAWTLSAPSQNLLHATETIVNDHFEKITRIPVKISEMKSKIGNIVTNLPLPSSALEGKSLFGG